MKNSNSINGFPVNCKRKREDQSAQLSPISLKIPKFINILAAALVLLLVPAGCNDDPVSPVSDSEKSLLLKNHHSLSVPGEPELLVSGLQGAAGSAIGPGGALYVTEPSIGRISRIDPRTGEVTTFVSDLPPAIVIFPYFSLGGVYDVTFIGGTAYALVTLVDSSVGGNHVTGIYRIDGPSSYTEIADIGQFSIDNPPGTPFDVASGVQFAIETYRGGFLVTDGHHNRVLHVTTGGIITEIKTFGNIVPTGLALSGNSIYMAEAGAAPHLPQDGKVVSFSPNSSGVSTIATGAPLAIDVEFNRGRTLFALAQGDWDGFMPGSPAEPDTGSLLRANPDGTFTTIADELDRPTSLEFIQNTAYIITMDGEVWTVANAASPPFGM